MEKPKSISLGELVITSEQINSFKVEYSPLLQDIQMNTFSPIETRRIGIQFDIQIFTVGGDLGEQIESIFSERFLFRLEPPTAYPFQNLPSSLKREQMSLNMDVLFTQFQQDKDESNLFWSVAGLCFPHGVKTFIRALSRSPEETELLLGAISVETHSILDAPKHP